TDRNDRIWSLRSGVKAVPCRANSGILAASHHVVGISKIVPELVLNCTGLVGGLQREAPSGSQGPTVSQSGSIPKSIGMTMVLSESSLGPFMLKECSRILLSIMLKIRSSGNPESCAAW